MARPFLLRNKQIGWFRLGVLAGLRVGTYFAISSRYRSRFPSMLFATVAI